eukprot:CAMPEP_0194213628 /NCGR_PEP_ID=MMETSP0156-20130528/14358_1 /TAXON_ID=33649 /ORGANISM="Thalassionema nitzschioides, Strain L26-B" /LENGTH=248 /DNA_ID=CAMNT_0038941703 /DNA_START=6 /DNA_END=753 /DNA_ORIENTATION=-
MADDHAADCVGMKDERRKNENVDNIKNDLQSTFEVEQVQHDKKTMIHERKRKIIPSWLVIFRYLVAAITAVSLSFFCPGTVLRQEDDILDINYVSGLIVAFISTLTALICVHNSNPGYLTADIVEDACKEDGLTLLGYEKENIEMSTFDALDLDVIEEPKTSTEATKRNTVTTDPEEDEVPFSFALDHPAPLFRGIDVKFVKPVSLRHHYVPITVASVIDAWPRLIITAISLVPASENAITAAFGTFY